MAEQPFVKKKLSNKDTQEKIILYSRKREGGVQIDSFLTKRFKNQKQIYKFANHLGAKSMK